MSEDKQTLIEDPQKQIQAARFAEENQITWAGELKFTAILLLCVLLLCGGIFIITYFFTPQGPNSGLDPRLQAIFLGFLSPARCSSNLKEITKQLHMTGTPASANLTNFITSQFKQYLGSFGSITQEKYDVLLSYPSLTSTVQVLNSQTLVPVLTAQLFEDEIASDEQTRTVNRAELARGFNAYSASGTYATSAYYYVNYGRTEDFAELVKRNISLNSTIVIARYGKIMPGLKAMNAEMNGCAGILLYSDPMEDGVSRGGVYPDGPYRPLSSIQRASAQYSTIYPGDPTTPNGPSTPGTRDRINRSDAENIPTTILVLPISARDSQSILSNLDGPDVPLSWVGALPIAYKIGGNGNKLTSISMLVQNKEEIKSIYNVFATIKGTVEPDRMVIVGNHRDAWLYGSVVGATGTIAQLELARSIGNLLRTTRFKPRRTIVFASWDAQLFGTVGSTEWVEDHKALLMDQLVAYINVDTNSGKIFTVNSSPSLASIVREEAEKLPSPIFSNSTLRESWSGETIYGAGSDDSAFFNHLGVSTLSLAFNNEIGAPGVAGSLYETNKYQQEQVDKDNSICVASAGIWGLVAVRLFNDEVLPFNHIEQATTLRKFYADLYVNPTIKNFNATLTAPDRDRFILSMNNLGDNLFTFIGLLETLQAQGNKLKTLGGQARDIGILQRNYNDKAMKVDRILTASEGLVGRSWYKHVICAPGKFTGNFDSFPSLVEAVSINSLESVLRANEQIVKVLGDASRYLSL